MHTTLSLNRLRRMGLVPFVSAALFIFPNIRAATAQENEASGAAEAEKIIWKTGADVQKQLRVSHGLTWKDASLRPAVIGLAGKVQVPIFLDRRVDPDQKIELSVSNVSLQELLSQLADKVQMGTCSLGPVQYIGPRATISRLPSVAAQRRSEAAALDAGIRAAWVKPKAWKWEVGATPRELVVELLKEAGSSLTNPELIPHDVWPGYDLPVMPLSDRLTLVLAGFDLTFQVSGDGSLVELIPFPAEAAYAHTYLLPEGGAALAADLQRRFPELKMERTGNRLKVTAGAEDHDTIERLLRGEQVTTKTKVPGKQQFSLTVDKQPAGAVLATVARQLKKELKYDPSLRDKLRENVSFSVKNVSLEELLAKTLTPLGLSCKVTAETLEVTASP